MGPSVAQMRCTGVVVVVLLLLLLTAEPAGASEGGAGWGSSARLSSASVVAATPQPVTLRAPMTITASNRAGLTGTPGSAAAGRRARGPR